MKVTDSCRSPAARRVPATPRMVATAASHAPAEGRLHHACLWGRVVLSDGLDP